MATRQSRGVESKARKNERPGESGWLHGGELRQELASKQVFFWLCACGFALELLYLLLLALSPLPVLRLFSTPFEEAWPWTLGLSHLLFAGNIEPGASWLYVSVFGLTLLALGVVFVVAVRSVFRGERKLAGEGSRRGWLMLLLGVSVIFCLTLLFQPALLSDDIFTTIFSGRMLAIYHADPLNNAPVQFFNDPYLRWVITGRNTPNIVGPVVLFMASALAAAGNSPVWTLLLFKVVVVCSHLLNCLLLWSILGRIAPERRVLGTLLYAWNPLVVIELAGSGHLDGILLSLLLVAVWLYVHGRSRWREIGVLIVLGVAISMNLIVVLVAPLYAWFAISGEGRITRAIWGFCWRTVLGQFVVFVMYLPFWRGEATFFAVTSAVDMEHFLRSPVGLLTGPFRWIFGLVATWSQFPPEMQPTTAADVTLRASSIFIFALVYLRQFGVVRSAGRAASALSMLHHAALPAKQGRLEEEEEGRRGQGGWAEGSATLRVAGGNTIAFLPGVVGQNGSRAADAPVLAHQGGKRTEREEGVKGIDALLLSWTYAIFWYLVLVLGWFLPWYALWALWVVALRRVDARSVAVLLLTGAALLSYILFVLHDPLLSRYQPLLIFGPSLVYLLIHWRKSRERKMTEYER